MQGRTHNDGGTPPRLLGADGNAQVDEPDLTGPDKTTHEPSPVSAVTPSHSSSSAT